MILIAACRVWGEESRQISWYTDYRNIKKKSSQPTAYNLYVYNWDNLEEPLGFNVKFGALAWYYVDWPDL